MSPARWPSCSTTRRGDRHCPPRRSSGPRTSPGPPARPCTARPTGGPRCCTAAGAEPPTLRRIRLVTDADPYGDELAVVTVTFSPGAVLDTFLDTLADATKRTPRIVLADNGSVDGAPERAAASRDGVELLRTGGNLGYGTAVNRAVASLPREFGWVAVANPDIEWTP